MRVLVTGAQGLLGSALVPALSADHDTAGVDLADFDLSDLGATVESVTSLAPDVVVNCAGWTDVDGAEREERNTFRANAIGARNAAIAANEAGAHLVQVSTDYVFDGTSALPYVESDPARPIGVYGRSKWMGECMVRDLARRWTIVRTQALYGDHGPSFVRAIRARIDGGDPLAVVSDQTTCPTRAVDLAAALARIVESGTGGVYHASSRGECTWFEFAREICAALEVPEHPLTPVSTESRGDPAPRPACSVLRNLHLELTIGDPFPHWRDALRAHLSGSEVSS